MAKTLRLIGLLAMALFVASSTVLPAPSSGIIGNAYQPRTRVVRIQPVFPVIKDQSILETGVIATTARIGHPRERYQDQPEDAAPITDTTTAIEQRRYSVTSDRSVEELGAALETMLALQGLDMATQVSISPSGEEGTVFFADNGSDVVAVFEVDSSTDGTSIHGTWTDQ